jgi:hypothetical protein
MGGTFFKILLVKNVFALTQLFENMEVAMDVGTSRLTSGKESTHMVWAKLLQLVPIVMIYD